jgi:pectate lyase
MKVRTLVAVWLLVVGVGTIGKGQLSGAETIREPDPASDAYDLNEDYAEARGLQTYHQLISDLSVKPVGDDDWYWWVAYSDGEVMFEVTEELAGDLRLEVYPRSASGAKGSLLDYSESPSNPVEAVSLTSVSAAQGFYIRVYSPSGGTNDRYTLEIKGTAAQNNGTPNRNPAANPNTVTVTEATPKQGIDVLWNDVDPDKDPLTLETHSDWYGRAIVNGQRIDYLPATSLTLTHDFTYVIKDDKGGRSKGMVTVSVTPLGSLAFPGADGYGALASGGRGSDAFVVDTVEDIGGTAPGPRGSLRQALQSGSKVVVFAVGPVIELSAYLYVPSNVTIAGETAPGSTGLSVYGHGTRITGDNVIVRYMRFRDQDRNRAPGQAMSIDSLEVLEADKVIVDHCSCSWGNDASLDVYKATNVTVQWSIISETLEPHSMAMVIQGPSAAGDDVRRTISLHHNLWAHNRARSPWLQHKYTGDIVNNVIYNWGGIDNSGNPLDPKVESSFGTQVGLSSDPNVGGTRANVVGNYFVAGKNSDDSNALRVTGHPDGAQVIAYVGTDPGRPHDKNLAALDETAPHPGASGSALVPTPSGNAVTQNSLVGGFVSVAVDAGGADEAYNRVLGDVFGLSGAGAVLVAPDDTVVLSRDITDDRIIDDVKMRDGFIVDTPPEDPTQ